VAYFKPFKTTLQTKEMLWWLTIDSNHDCKPRTYNKFKLNFGCEQIQVYNENWGGNQDLQTHNITSIINW
jgi:hypothetical protein